MRRYAALLRPARRLDARELDQQSTLDQRVISREEGRGGGQVRCEWDWGAAWTHLVWTHGRQQSAGGVGGAGQGGGGGSGGMTVKSRRKA